MFPRASRRARALPGSRSRDRAPPLRESRSLPRGSRSWDSRHRLTPHDRLGQDSANIHRRSAGDLMRRTRIWMALFALIACGLIVSRVVRPGPIRTIRVSMKGYAFNEGNPTITLYAGERVRFVVTN